MKWKEEQCEKIKNSSSLLISLFVDAVLMIIVFFMIEEVKVILEKFIFHNNLDDAFKDDNKLKIIYDISKYFILSLFSLYVISDISSQILKIFNSIKSQIAN